MSAPNPSPVLTIVTPTFEKHFVQFKRLVESVSRFCVDKHYICLRIVVEHKNIATTNNVLAEFPDISSSIITTEEIYSLFGIENTPIDFLSKAGKFTFQSIKKIGGIVTAETNWLLVMDSESMFFKDFSAKEILDNYRAEKYVFYTNVSDRGPLWAGSLSESVTVNAAHLVGGRADRWYMEYYHWFYERSVWKALIDKLKSNGGFSIWMSNTLPMGVFENILYYQFVAESGRFEYVFLDSLEVLSRHLPPHIFSRLLSAINGPMQVVGLVEHLLKVVSADEIPCLAPFFEHFSLPFMRFEPDSIDPAILEAAQALPSIRAFTSSHRLSVMRKRVAVCISGEFRSVFANVGSLRQFTTGVACDLFVHTWNDENVPAIADALRPHALIAENKPDFQALTEMIGNAEPNAKENRDAGSLAMFYGIQRSIEMIHSHVDNYDLVVRIRPDIAYQQSLRQLLFAIADIEEEDADSIYVPDSFHSQGLNDQLAIGPVTAMQRYARVFDYAQARAKAEYFNPEHIMSAHVLDAGLHVTVLPIHYILLRHEPANFDHVGHLQERQNLTWWSAPLPGPRIARAATAFFAIKRRAMSDVAAANLFEGGEMLMDAAFFVPAARDQLPGLVAHVSIRRDYKNPDSVLAVRLQGGGNDLFVSVEADGLHIVEHRPVGVLFALHAEDDRLTLVRFVDRLDEPYATVTVRTYPTSGPIEPWSRAANPAAVEASTGAKRVENDDYPLLAHLLLTTGDGEVPGRWRRMRARLLLRRARQARRAGDVDRAEVIYAHVLRMEPTRAREWVQYGHVLKDRGNWTAAIAAYRMALYLQPGNPDPLTHLNNAITRGV